MGHFADVSLQAGTGISDPVPARGCAFGDFDNDGNIDVVVNTVNDFPQLLHSSSSTGNNWIKVRTIGTKSNRSSIGARLTCVTLPPENPSLTSRSMKFAAEAATFRRTTCASISDWEKLRRSISWKSAGPAARSTRSRM